MKCLTEGCECNTKTFKPSTMGMIIVDGEALCANNHISPFSCRNCHFWRRDEKERCDNPNWSSSSDPSNPRCHGLMFAWKQ
jgi:hypothetical protein